MNDVFPHFGFPMTQILIELFSSKSCDDDDDVTRGLGGNKLALEGFGGSVLDEPDCFLDIFFL